MRVELTFDHEGQQYKVLRQRKSGKRGASILDLQGWDTNTESWKGLSEATIRGTQNRIEKLIRIDYETFVNSAFLVQGRADEFTMKTPNQRKEVLANILGLSVWDMYEDQAKEGARANRENLNHIEGRLAEIERELNRRGEYEADLADAEGKAQNVASRLAEFEAQWANLEHARTQLVSYQRQIDDLTKRIVRLEKEVEQAKSDKQAAAPQADKEAINSALSTINKALDELEPLLKQQKELQSKQSNLVSDRAHLSGVNAAARHVDSL
jgi:exonuclease SbcC